MAREFRSWAVLFLACARVLSRSAMSNSSATLWTVAHQAPWDSPSGLLFPFPGDLPDSGIKTTSPALQADSSPLLHLGSPHAKLVFLDLGRPVQSELLREDTTDRE